MDYIHLQSKYFSAFIDKDRYTDVKSYITANRKDKSWGDNLEVQAMAELYDIPVEIYEYSTSPVKTFNNNASRLTSNPQATLRLSYHNGNHYNAIVNLRWACDDHKFITQEAGNVEDQKIAQVMSSMDLEDIPSDFEQHEIDRSRASMIFEADMEVAIAASRQGFELSMSMLEGQHLNQYRL